ncbi:NAD(P)/FAD-dependent oxidoreductase [Alicyclobacillus ferrooxydans]|uniref:FAD/NAD(P)-binding domain-containing protein n=1 Tax=Alicyclobacillus ferrooxydans TaxID=471514 RepID=A0A0P9CFP5_9BACL|nr:NAD(P)/FAD-dependent oxidoreductase [Alicyclobacillus ferrooxydans]KPV44618.1 hypothetical protein AN477_06420 [Alicyclobacillus ferrooxydans]
MLIIGGGPAGLSAAYACQTLGMRHLLLEGTAELGGQLSWTHSTIHGFLFSDAQSPAAVRQQFVDAVVDKGCQFETSVKAKQIIVGDNRPITVVVRGEHEQRDITCRKLIVAAGAKARRLGVPGEDLPQVYGASFSVTKHSALFQGKVVAVIGGGDRALEGALYAANAGAQVMLIHRGAEFSARQEFRTALLRQPQVKVMLNTSVASISNSSRGMQQVTRNMMGTVKLRLVNHCEGQCSEEIVDAVVLRIGMAPDTTLLEGVAKMNADHTVVTNRFLQTTHSDIYAIGDIATPTFATSLAVAVSHGALAVRHIALTLGD